MSRYLVWLLGGGSVLAAVAVAGYFGLNLRDDPAPVVVTPRESAPTAAPIAANDPGPIGTEPVVEEAEAAVPMPTFDVVRVARDGAALVAGSAMPGAAVTLSVDGVVVAEVAADANGQYVALFELGVSDEAQSMTLSMRDADGTVLTAEDTVILTPRPAQLAALDVPEAANVDAAPVADAEAPEVEETPAEADVAEIEAPAEEVETATSDAQPADVDVTRTASTEAEASVETPGPTAFLLRGDGQVERLDTAPGVANVVVDTIAYTAEGAVQIAGRAAEGASAALRLYLNNDFLAETRADAGEWSLDLPEVAPGVYTLRVDQLDDAGRVVSRFETPFLREAPERVAEAQAAMAAGTPVTETAAAAEAVTEPAPEAESPAEDVAVIEEAAEDAPVEIAALDLPEEAAASSSTEASSTMSEATEATEVMEDPAVVPATEATDEAATIEAVETEAAEDVMASQAEESEASAEAPASDAPATPPVVASAPATGEFAETEEAVTEEVVVEDAAELPSATQTETTPRETASDADAGDANPVASAPTPERVVSEAAASSEQNAGNTATVSAETPTQSAEVPVTESASTTTQTEQADVATATSESSAVGESSSAPAAPTTAEASASAAASASTSSSSTGSSAGTSPSQTSSAGASSGAVAEGAIAAQSMGVSSSQSGTSATTTSSANGSSSGATQPAASTSSSSSASGSSTQASASAESSSAGTASSTAPAAPRVSLITVQPGHTLWHISRERYGQGEQYVIIYNANRSQIRDPDLIYPGQIFTLPDR
ncbi:LysM peptidoglycan-binding domain-containing protein [Pararhodobacter sp. CCB-MM2]|uniref:LysM peptidoglycan-binding domain-containing protein n=1 Tax=Pararhodobacter sp. CCB-MM2 TaxID=1786003 RepID=UPI000831CE28|nr:LysM peptidoglycan-binding domain-containing protein [Pararhodobacter sp. CCB-MM2]